MKKVFSLLTFCALISLTACSPSNLEETADKSDQPQSSKTETTATPTEPVENSDMPDSAATLSPLGTWQIVSRSINGTDQNHTNQNWIVTFEQKELSGNICNNFFGQYTVTPDNTIKGSKIGSTKKLCPPEIMEMEDLFLKNLEKSIPFTFDEAGNLKLTDDQGGEIILIKK